MRRASRCLARCVRCRLLARCGSSTSTAAVNRVGNGTVKTVHVQGSVYMLVGAGANIVVQVGDDGVLVVDTGAAGMTDNMLAAIRQLSKRTSAGS